MTDEQTLDEQVSDLQSDELGTESASVSTDQQRIEQLEDELATAKENVLRATAEMQNVRRRAEQDIEKAHKFALEKFATDLLAVLDSLERGLEVSDPTDEKIRPMREGLELAYKVFLATLKRFPFVSLRTTGMLLLLDLHNCIV